MLCLSRSRLDGIETILGVVVVVAAVVVVEAVVEGNAMVGAGVAGERVTGTAERGEGVTVSGGRCGWLGVGWGGIFSEVCKFVLHSSRSTNIRRSCYNNNSNNNK